MTTQPPQTPQTPQTPKPTRRFNLSALGPLLGLFVLMVAGTLLNPDFIQFNNLSNIVSRTSFIGIIAIGATFVIISGGIDLSVGAMAALIAGVVILTLNAVVSHLGVSALSVAVGMIVALLMGALFGLMHGLLITKGRIEPFIVTLGTLGIYRSVLTFLANGGTISLGLDLGDLYGPVFYGRILGIPNPIWVFLVVALLGGLILNRTQFGRYVQAIGSSEQVARYSAIPVDRIKVLTYVLQGVCVALATIVYVPQLGSSNSTTGLGWELSAIAAVIIGGTALKGGSGRIFGTVVGAILFETIGNILNLTSIISNYLNGAVQGVILIAVAFLQRGSKK